MINILDKSTIDKIAAGEVVERPASIVKELLENSIDALSDQIAIEIKNGGTSLIRITDNGQGIAKEDIKKAFLRHATSKIKTADDLENVLSLGFRGEALSSIGAVTRTEIISKTRNETTAALYKVEGGFEKSFEEVAAPDGTTIIVKDLFFNTPARRKFLKSLNSETAKISDIVEKLALSHPDISFRYISNNINKLHTGGNSNLKDVIYQIYGKEATRSLIEIKYQDDIVKISGFISKPDYSRANRSGEIYFINSRYIKNDIIYKAIEDGYGNRLMNGKYPFTSLNIEILPKLIDVNVHPSKMEIRFEDASVIYSIIKSSVENTLLNSDLVKRAYISQKDRQEELKRELFEKLELQNKLRFPESFEKNRIKEFDNKSSGFVKEQKTYDKIFEEIDTYKTDNKNEPYREYKVEFNKDENLENNIIEKKDGDKIYKENVDNTQLNFFDKQNIKRHKLIGQIFSTYWIIELDNEMFIIDQHAAHEKVLYEKFLEEYEKGIKTKQYILPPIVINMTDVEIEAFENNREVFEKLGFELEHFGGKDYKLNAIPNDLPSIDKKELFLELIAKISESDIAVKAEHILDKLASISCKAAIKGNQNISEAEADILITKMLSLNNPYNCPHGRPTIIKISKYDLEKKFKRII